MEVISSAIACNDQPINAATLLGESCYLTSWVTPDNLEIQSKYNELTKGLSTQRDKITACWNYVKSLRYRQFIQTKVRLDGQTYVQEDAWLNPAQVMHAPAANCANRSFLLASLLRQELSPQQIYICFGNLNYDHQDGHAWVYAKLDKDYLLETTSPSIKTPFLDARSADIYESVMFFNDSGVWHIPGAGLREPLSACYCIRWLEDYLATKSCDFYLE